jgi:hypothetical protein
MPAFVPTWTRGNVRNLVAIVGKADAWDKTIMTDTISPLREPNTISYRLVEDWGRATKH